jgi:hypothetical protein
VPVARAARRVLAIRRARHRLSSFFQFRAQSGEAFGEYGMSKFQSVANIRVAGTGLAKNKFRSFLSSLIRKHDVTKRSS